MCGAKQELPNMNWESNYFFITSENPIMMSNPDIPTALCKNCGAHIFDYINNKRATLRLHT